jgi:membrane associated rhomboid family serine protease
MIPIRSTVATHSAPILTLLLIATNCAIFLYQISLSDLHQETFLLNYALIPVRYFAPDTLHLPAPRLLDYLPFATNMFLHGGWLHLIVNMWTLWIFGPAIEDRLGSTRYLVFYLACGVLASATHAIFNATSAVPALGASGAIAGVLGCYARLFPFARVIVLVPVLFLPLFFELHAILFVGLWFILQVLQGTAELLRPSLGGGVAWWAHIGGFVAGLAFAGLLMPARRRYRRYFGDEGIYGFGPDGFR